MHSIALYSLVLLWTVSWGCPPKEALYPCTCERPEDSAYITCMRIYNPQVLLSATSSLVGRNYIYSLVIDGSVFFYIPSAAFEGTSIVELEIKNTTLMALTDTDVAFEGLEEHLEIFLMTDCTLMNQWDWSIFRNLQKIRRLDIVRSNLLTIDEDLDFINTTSVQNISFAGNQISYVHPMAFAKFKDLKFLSLRENLITEVKRSMIPDPANYLMSLDLSNNDIKELPSDMFTNMPVLETLSISSNKLFRLEEPVFKPIWSQLDGFNALGNELLCDCKMDWIRSTPNPKDLRAVCTRPYDIKGRNLRDLTSRDLSCYYYLCYIEAIKKDRNTCYEGH